MRACWKPGYLYLTATRVLFYQGPNKLFELPTARIRSVGIVERRWVSRKTCPQLAVRQASSRGESTIHLRTEDLEAWRGRLLELISAEAGTVPEAAH